MIANCRFFWQIIAMIVMFSLFFRFHLSSRNLGYARIFWLLVNLLQNFNSSVSFFLGLSNFPRPRRVQTTDTRDSKKLNRNQVCIGCYLTRPQSIWMCELQANDGTRSPAKSCVAGGFVCRAGMGLKQRETAYLHIQQPFWVVHSPVAYGPF